MANTREEELSPVLLVIDKPFETIVIILLATQALEWFFNTFRIMAGLIFSCKQNKKKNVEIWIR